MQLARTLFFSSLQVALASCLRRLVFGGASLRDAHGRASFRADWRELQRHRAGRACLPLLSTIPRIERWRGGHPHVLAD